eukprot:g36064.t1
MDTFSGMDYDALDLHRDPTSLSPALTFTSTGRVVPVYQGEDGLREVEVHLPHQKPPELSLKDGLMQPTRSFKQMLRTRQEEALAEQRAAELPMPTPASQRVEGWLMDARRKKNEELKLAKKEQDHHDRLMKQIQKEKNSQHLPKVIMRLLKQQTASTSAKKTTKDRLRKEAEKVEKQQASLIKQKSMPSVYSRLLQDATAKKEKAVKAEQERPRSPMTLFNMREKEKASRDAGLDKGRLRSKSAGRNKLSGLLLSGSPSPARVVPTKRSKSLPVVPDSNGMQQAQPKVLRGRSGKKVHPMAEVKAISPGERSHHAAQQHQQQEQQATPSQPDLEERVPSRQGSHEEQEQQDVAPEPVAAEKEKPAPHIMQPEGLFSGLLQKVFRPDKSGPAAAEVAPPADEKHTPAAESGLEEGEVVAEHDEAPAEAQEAPHAADNAAAEGGAGVPTEDALSPDSNAAVLATVAAMAPAAAAASAGRTVQQLPGSSAAAHKRANFDLSALTSAGRRKATAEKSERAGSGGATAAAITSSGRSVAKLLTGRAAGGKWAKQVAPASAGDGPATPRKKEQQGLKRKGSDKAAKHTPQQGGKPHNTRSPQRAAHAAPAIRGGRSKDSKSKQQQHGDPQASPPGYPTLPPNAAAADTPSPSDPISSNQPKKPAGKLAALISKGPIVLKGKGKVRKPEPAPANTHEEKSAGVAGGPQDQREEGEVPSQAAAAGAAEQQQQQQQAVDQEMEEVVEEAAAAELPAAREEGESEKLVRKISSASGLANPDDRYWLA